MYVKLDHYVVDVLMRDLTGHDRKPAAFVVYLFLWYRTYGSDARSLHASHQTIANATGLSRRAVQNSIQWLLRRRLIRVHRAHRTAIPEYTVNRPWKHM
ncbi:MAG TPA: helix-turn-helix domain-containing protein [Terriglobales bacterium]|nr:helix-turn-helix domain-containing protein [Terriglobales bacterium]